MNGATRIQRVCAFAMYAGAVRNTKAAQDSVEEPGILFGAVTKTHIAEFTQGQRLGMQYCLRMTERTDLITASRVDLALILLPISTWLEASCMLALSGVPVEVAARVIAEPAERRATQPGAFPV
jgi:hypothetical protein